MSFGKKNPMFKYCACTFGISKDKSTTARAAAFEITKNVNIMTIEISSFGLQLKNQ